MTRPARNGVDVPSVFAVIDGVKGGNPGWWNDCGFRRSTCSRPGTGTAPSPAAPGPGHEDSHHAIGGLTRPPLTDCSTGPRRIRERQGPMPDPTTKGSTPGPDHYRGQLVGELSGPVWVVSFRSSWRARASVMPGWVSLGSRSRKRTPRPPTKRFKASSGFLHGVHLRGSHAYRDRHADVKGGDIDG